MTDKKALEVLKSWLQLAYQNADGTDECCAELYEALQTVFALINRQQAEIERLKGSVIVNNIMESQKIKREAKFEAIKEFAEKLKLHSYIMSDESQTGIINRYSVVTVNQIDNILKELVGNER